MKQSIVVGMSGGKDSTAAVLLLREMGYQPIGVFVTLGNPMPKHLPQLAQKLGIKLIIEEIDFTKLVIEPSLNMWRRGITPNPCAICNARAKLAGLKTAADRLGIHLLATGHYADIDDTGILIEPEAGSQAYFLALVPPDILKRLRLPLSGENPNFVKQLLDRYDIHIPQRPSQDLCFAKNLKEFLKRHLGIKPGPIILYGSGEVIGQHRGAHFYTIGERVGAVGGRRVYVKEIRRNVLIASPEPEPVKRNIILTDAVIHGDLQHVRYIRTRYRGPLKPVYSAKIVDGVIYLETEAVAPPGQLGVLYSEDMHIIAGGIIGG